MDTIGYICRPMRKVFQIAVFLAVLFSLYSAGAFTKGNTSLPPPSENEAARDSISVTDSVVSPVADSVGNSHDSLTASVSDSLDTSLDSLSTPPDSLFADSLAIDSAVVDSTVADSIVLTPRDLKRMYRDSMKLVRDSIRMVTPRILRTSAFPDSLYYRRALSWHSDSKVNNLTAARIDTTYNDWYTEYPFFKKDVNGIYLGVIGSSEMNYNWFKRDEFTPFAGYTPYVYASYTPDNMPMYNVKSTYTELCYWGTIFAYKNKEEGNLKLLHTQNITPALNLAIQYQTFGGRGLLTNESTRNNTFTFTGNYLGKRYVANFGYIRNMIIRQENGGVRNISDVKDTTVDLKTVAVNLSDADSKLGRNTFYIHHHYAVPLSLLHQQRLERRALKDSLAMFSDSLFLQSDTLSTHAAASDNPDAHTNGQEPPKRTSEEMKLDDGTQISFGHIGEVSIYSRRYSDKISSVDEKNYYHNAFYINPTQSYDSTRVLSVENKAFVRLQPWAPDAIVSKIDAGAGYQFQSIYGYTPDMMFTGNKNKAYHNVYIYGGASGQYKKYLHWGADVRYDFLGYYQNDLDVNAKVSFSFFPFKDKSRGVDISGKFSTTLRRPDYFSNHYYSNHYVWDNDFSKVSTTKFEAQFDIEKWKFQVGAGYGIVKNMIYYDTLGIIQQDEGVNNILSAYLKKDFKLWLFHLDNQILFQMASNQNTLPLPMLSLHLRYYIEFTVVKNAMTMQIGVDGTYNTAYYVPAWNPATGQFHVQNTEKLGNRPYLDVFVNVQWKKVSMFLKVTNVAQGWPDGDFFSAYGYVKPERNFKLGIHWPFYFK